MTEDYPSEKKALRLLTLACPDADPELREELAYLVSARRRTIDDAVQFLHDKDLKAQQLKKEEEEKQKEKARLQEKLKKQEEERKKEQARKEAEAAEAAKAKAAQREAMKAANGTTGMPDPTIEMLGDTPLTEAEKDMVKMVHYFYGDTVENFDRDVIGSGDQVILFTTSMTGDRQVRDHCRQLETLLFLKQIPYHLVDVADNAALQRKAKEIYMKTTKKHRMPTMPLLCVDYTYIGGYQEVQDMEDFGELDDKLEKTGYIPKDEIRRRATAAMVKEEEERKAKEEEQRLAEEAKKREEELKMERRIRQLQGLPPLEEGEEKKDGELPPLHAEVEEKPKPTVKPVAVLEERAPPLPNFSANRGVVSVLSTTEEGSSIAGNYPSAASVVANSMKKKRQALMTYSEYKPSQSTSVKEGSGFGKLSTRELLELSRSNGTTLSHSKNATTLPPATTRSPTSPSKSKIDASAYSNPIIRTPAAPQDGGYAAKKGTKGADSVSPTMQTPLSSKSDNSAKAAAALLPSQRRLSKEPAQKNTGVLAH